MTKSTTPNSVEFGLLAPPMKVQHPVLSVYEADQFDRDNAALMRLSIRGYLTGRQKFAARKKITSSIGKAIRSALDEPSERRAE